MLAVLSITSLEVKHLERERERERERDGVFFNLYAVEPLIHRSPNVLSFCRGFSSIEWLLSLPSFRVSIVGGFTVHSLPEVMP